MRMSPSVMTPDRKRDRPLLMVAAGACLLAAAQPPVAPASEAAVEPAALSEIVVLGRRAAPDRQPKEHRADQRREGRGRRGKRRPAGPPAPHVRTGSGA